MASRGKPARALDLRLLSCAAVPALSPEIDLPAAFNTRAHSCRHLRREARARDVELEARGSDCPRRQAGSIFNHVILTAALANDLNVENMIAGV